MSLFRHALFALLLLLAQSGALAHGVEHLRSDADRTATHGCALCLAAQGIDTALVATAPALALCAAGFAAPVHLVTPRPPVARVSPRARAPPAA